MEITVFFNIKCSKYMDVHVLVMLFIGFVRISKAKKKRISVFLMTLKKKNSGLVGQKNIFLIT